MQRRSIAHAGSGGFAKERYPRALCPTPPQRSECARVGSFVVMPLSITVPYTPHPHSQGLACGFDGTFRIYLALLRVMIASAALATTGTRRSSPSVFAV